MTHNPFQHCVVLKQHTPILHFQHERDYATLRATELKPKLDKYLFREAFANEFEDYKTFLKGYNAIEEKEYLKKGKDYKVTFEGKMALDYSVKINATTSNASKYVVGNLISERNKNDLNNKRIDFIEKTAYFADAKPITEGLKVGGKLQRNDFSDLKMGVMQAPNDAITVLFQCYHTTLLTKIKEWLPAFFVTHNFGCRQNKGFGSFTVQKEGQNFSQFAQKNSEIEAVYRKECSSNDFKIILADIQNTYQRLKAGVNYPYAKSKLMIYMCEQEDKIRWEKRRIKQEIEARFPDVFKQMPTTTHPNRIAGCDEEEAQESFAFVRALLGLAEYIEFSPKGPKIKVNIEDASTDKEDKVDRFKSPITFKVIGKQVFLLVHAIPKELYKKKDGEEDRRFNFTLETDIKDSTTHKNISEFLFDLPVPFNFSITDFLDKNLNGYKKITN